MNLKCYAAQDWDAVKAQLEQTEDAKKARQLEQILQGSIPVGVWRDVLLDVVATYQHEKSVREFWQRQGIQEAKVSFERIRDMVDGKMKGMKSDAGRVDWLQRMLCGSWISVDSG